MLDASLNEFHDQIFHFSIYRYLDVYDSKELYYLKIVQSTIMFLLNPVQHML